MDNENMERECDADNAAIAHDEILEYTRQEKYEEGRGGGPRGPFDLQ